MVFCNTKVRLQTKVVQSHNPYFSRWFSAIALVSSNSSKALVTILILVDGFLQFLAHYSTQREDKCHNPYFSRWFSAIYTHNKDLDLNMSQSLF